MNKFPDHIGWDNWGSLMCDAELFAPLVREALEAHNLPGTPISAGFPGTHAVFLAGDVVVKLYAPLGIPDAYAEPRAYRASQGLPLIPRLLGEGTLHAGGYAWPYIITDFMPGMAAREVWPSLSPAERRAAMQTLGAWSKAYHALPDPFDPSSSLSAPGFPDYRNAQIRKNTAALACPAFTEPAIANLTSLIRREPPVLIHNDLTEDHLLINGDRYAVIDLADSRMGYEPIEWLCVWFGITSMDHDAFLNFLEASGRTWNAQSRQDMMTCSLIHGFGASILKDASKRTGRPIPELFPEI